MFDLLLFSLPAGLIIGMFELAAFEEPGGDQLLGIIVLFFWVFAETSLLSSFGTTPGKWMLNTRVVRSNGTPISHADALGRSMKVWWRGVGIGLPLVSLVTLIVAHNNLKRNGTTSWDTDGDLIVRHGPVGVGRTLVLVLFFVTFAVLMALGSSA